MTDETKAELVKVDKQILIELIELITTLEEYVKLLGDEIDGLVPYAAPHGWASTRYEKGKKLRERIEELKGELNK